MGNLRNPSIAMIALMDALKSDSSDNWSKFRWCVHQLHHPDVTTTSGMTLLMKACFEGAPRAVSILLEAGALPDRNDVDRYGSPPGPSYLRRTTALIHALRREMDEEGFLPNDNLRLEVVDILLRAGAKTTAPGAEASWSLACQAGVRFAHRLLDEGLPLPDEKGNTAFHWAAVGLLRSRTACPEWSSLFSRLHQAGCSHETLNQAGLPAFEWRRPGEASDPGQEEPAKAVWHAWILNHSLYEETTNTPCRSRL